MFKVLAMAFLALIPIVAIAKDCGPVDPPSECGNLKVEGPCQNGVKTITTRHGYKEVYSWNDKCQTEAKQEPCGPTSHETKSYVAC